MSMQMDAEFKKEQIGTLFCLVGALEGGFGGGSGVSSFKSIRAFQNKYMPPAQGIKFQAP